MGWQYNTVWSTHGVLCVILPSQVQRLLLLVLQHDLVYQTLTAEQQLLLWEQGICPSSEVHATQHHTR